MLLLPPASQPRLNIIFKMLYLLKLDFYFSLKWKFSDQK